MKKVMFVFGTRPEAIKMCPIIKVCNKNRNLQCSVCVTGQHREMLQQVLEIFQVVPDYNLEIMQKNQTLFDITIQILNKIRNVLETEKPDIVMVHGDTTTTFVTSLACFYLKIPVGHVEAGLRTYDINSPYPEEFNRQAVSIVAQYNFAPTYAAKENLLLEGKKEKSIYVTGNTVIDALRTTLQTSCNNENIEWLRSGRGILLTAHRRENIGEPLYHIFKAVKQIANDFKDVRILYPIHLNPKVRKIAYEVFEGVENIRLIEPQDVITFHHLMNAAYFIMTDSGGIQEEAPALGKPVLVMRDTTERPEGVEAGTLKLVGTLQTSVYNAAAELLTDKKAYEKMSKAENPYGDGHASEKIMQIIVDSV